MHVTAVDEQIGKAQHSAASLWRRQDGQRRRQAWSGTAVGNGITCKSIATAILISTIWAPRTGTPSPRLDSLGGWLAVGL